LNPYVGCAFGDNAVAALAHEAARLQMARLEQVRAVFDLPSPPMLLNCQGHCLAAKLRPCESLL
jgi:hypothetical protein